MKKPMGLCPSRYRIETKRWSINATLKRGEPLPVGSVRYKVYEVRQYGKGVSEVIELYDFFLNALFAYEQAATGRDRMWKCRCGKRCDSWCRVYESFMGTISCPACGRERPTGKPVRARWMLDSGEWEGIV